MPEPTTVDLPAARLRWRRLALVYAGISLQLLGLLQLGLDRGSVIGPAVAFAAGSLLLCAKALLASVDVRRRRGWAWVRTNLAAFQLVLGGALTVTAGLCAAVLGAAFWLAQGSTASWWSRALMSSGLVWSLVGIIGRQWGLAMMRREQGPTRGAA